MEIFSLVGTSGTGKSTNALAFAHENNIPAIIDDGLLIVNGQMIAGTSAKFEKTTLAAVRRAIFLDPLHATEVQEAIEKYFISRILLIGTSTRMVKIIADKLQIGEIDHYLQIEDISSSSAIKMAEFVRRTQGKHLIPIPYKQVEQSFFKKVIQKGKDIFSAKKEIIGQTTIVHPDFHRGSIFFSEKVFISVISHICNSNKGIAECRSVNLSFSEAPKISVVIGITPSMSKSILAMIEQLQKEIKKRFIELFDIELDTINFSIQTSIRKRTD